MPDWAITPNMDKEQVPNVQVLERAGNGVLVLCGSIDITCVEDLRQAALQLLEQSRHTTASCEQIDYIDTPALQILTYPQDGVSHT